MREPETKSEYRLYSQTLYADGSTEPWETTNYASKDRDYIEAMAARFVGYQPPQLADRRNYAVVEFSIRPVRIYDAPMRAG